MSLKELELDQIHLTSVSDKLRLSINSSATFQIPALLSQLSQRDTAKALTSGNVWISRGTNCGLDIHVYFDGKRLEKNRRLHVLESLGYRLRDAHLWSQLLLSPSLEIRSLEDPFSDPDLSILIGHGRPPPNTAAIEPGAWLSSNININAPESVLTAELGRLHISLEFHTIPARGKHKRVKTKAKVDDSDDTMLLDAPPKIVDEKYLDALEGVVDSLSQGLSSSIASCFDSFQVANRMKLPQISSNVRSGPKVHQRTSPKLEEEEDLLLISDQFQSSFVSPNQTDDEMLFAQTTETTPSLSSQATTLSTLSRVSSATSLKRSQPSDSHIPAQLETLSTLKLSPACKLADVGLRILIGGYERRRTKGLLGMRVDKPDPETSFSDLAPGIFSPTFKEFMSHNARFLPTISQAISCSWPRNVQSPILKRKLIQLANSPSSSLEARTRNTDDPDATTDHLSSVVQARLWAMMQRKLYDPATSRIFFNSRSSDKAAAEPKPYEEYDDLLAELDNTSTRTKENSIHEDLEAFMKEQFGYEDEFEDLLGDASEDDDFLGYLDASEREKLEVEHETDEMLFRDSRDGNLEDDGEDMLLLERDTDDESMLL